MNDRLIIALDAMGGDHAPAAVIEGAHIALKKRDHDLGFTLFGDESKITPILNKYPDLKAVSTIVHTTSVVAAQDKPSIALRQGKQSSMRLAIDAVANDKAQAIVSAGNTGALMAMGKLALRTLEGISRPAIVTTMPTLKGSTVVLDLGANVDCDANDLVQFAIMGDAFARVMLKRDKPSIGLLNVGSEEMKGHDDVKLAHQLLKQPARRLNFYGFVEGNDIPEGTVDVVVTDGFTGNVALKTAEGIAKLTGTLLVNMYRSSLMAKIGYLFVRGALKRVRKTVDARRYNGAMFIGLGGILVKSHGSADGYAFSFAINVAAELARHDINDRIIEEIRQSGDLSPHNGMAELA